MSPGQTSVILAETEGIRTLDRALQPYNGLANRRLQPLGHVSRAQCAPRHMPDACPHCKRMPVELSEMLAETIAARGDHHKADNRPQAGRLPESGFSRALTQQTWDAVARVVQTSPTGTRNSFRSLWSDHNGRDRRGSTLRARHTFFPDAAGVSPGFTEPKVSRLATTKTCLHALAWQAGSPTSTKTTASLRTPSTNRLIRGGRTASNRA